MRRDLRGRLDSLENAAGQGDDTGPRVVFIVSVAPADDAGEHMRRLGSAIVIGKPGVEGKSVGRGDDELERDFLARVAAVYETIHGPVSDDWYERQRDAA